MMYRILLLTLFVSAHPIQSIAAEPETKLNQALNLLGSTKIGADELKLAKDLHIPIVAGNVSRTDVTATRAFQGKEETLTFHTQVLISQDKEIVFQALDLAHELVHALNPKSNPFDPKLNAVDYIREGIESVGGEAQAILQECKVGQELVAQVPQEQGQLIKARCQFVWKTEKDMNQWKLSFYHLGKSFAHFNEELRATKPDPQKQNLLSRIIQAKDPMFTSAAANKPYPLALLDEYVEITQKICTKTLQRKIASNSVAGNTTAAAMDERCQSLSSAQFSQ